MSESRKRVSTKQGGSANKKAASSVPYDSDEELPAESVQDRLGWRLSQEESHSDWTIEIVYKTTDRAGNISNVTDTYHVHKYFLVVGPRKSEYFVRLFHDGGRFSESETQTSRIEFNEIAAKVFPLLLDFLYSPEAELQLTSENATALHSMAKYFDIRHLRRETNQFWQKDMTSATCGTYYEHARILQDEKILKAASATCAKNIMEITNSSRLVHVPDPEFWLDLLQQTTITSNLSRHVSTLIAKFCQQNEVDAATFKKLTDDKYLPEIDADAALPLMDAESEIAFIPNASRLSILQKRCVDAIARDWKSLNLQQASTAALLRKQSPLVIGEILTRSLSAAKTAMENLEKDSQELNCFHRLPNKSVYKIIQSHQVESFSLPQRRPHSREGAVMRPDGFFFCPEHHHPVFFYKKT